MVIYKTTNLINEKIYIGQDFYNNPSYLGSGILLKRALKKYGYSNFKKEIIDVASTIDELNEKEKYWIAFYKSQNLDIGYNIAPGGGQSIRTEEYKMNISKNHADVNGEKNPMYNLHMYDIWVEKFGKEIADKKLLHARELVSKSLKEAWTDDKKEIRRKKYTARGNPRYKATPILQFTLDDIFVKEWPDLISTKEAGMNEKCISSTCRGLHKTAYGYKWKFKNIENENIND